MNIKYRKSFLKDLKKLKNLEVYNKATEIAFTILPHLASLRMLDNVKPMTGYKNRYRISLGKYRIGVEIAKEHIEIVRILHRKEFYRFFPWNIMMAIEQNLII